MFFDEFYEKSMDMLKKLNLKKTSLQVELEDKDDEIERLNINPISQNELEETRRNNVDLKIKLEEAKKMEDILSNQLDEKQRTCEHLEMEVVDLRKKNQKTDDSIKFKNSTAILDEILDC